MPIIFWAHSTSIHDFAGYFDEMASRRDDFSLKLRKSPSSAIQSTTTRKPPPTFTPSSRCHERLSKTQFPVLPKTSPTPPPPSASQPKHNNLHTTTRAWHQQHRYPAVQMPRYRSETGSTQMAYRRFSPSLIQLVCAPILTMLVAVLFQCYRPWSSAWRRNLWALRNTQRKW